MISRQGGTKGSVEKDCPRRLNVTDAVNAASL
jgi:hypothetical protein